MKLTALILGIAILASNALAQSSPKSELGLGLGWGSPIGFGAEYSYYVQDALSINGGAGFSFGGGRFSLGGKYFFLDQNSASPYVGLNLIRSTGLSSVNVTVNNNQAEYSINSATTLEPRVGWRFKTRPINWYINTGYGIVVSGGGAKYISGSTSSSVKDFANVIAAGGFELSGNMMFKF